MNCKQIQKTIIDILSDDISEKTRNDIELHCLSCLKCRTLLQDFHKIKTCLSQFKAKPLPQGFADKIINELPSTTKRANEFYFVKKWHYAVLLVILFFGIGKYLSPTEKFPILSDQADKVTLKTIEVTPKVQNNKLINKEEIFSRQFYIRKSWVKQKIVFRGANSPILKSKTFIKEWRGFSKIQIMDDYMMILDSKTWNAYWKDHISDQVPDIDFNNNLVIAVSSKQDKLYITDIQETDDRYFVDVKEISSSKINSKGSPYHIVSISK